MWCSGEIFVKWLAPTYLYHVPAAKSSSRIGAARKLNLKSEVPPHCHGQGYAVPSIGGGPFMDCYIYKCEIWPPLKKQFHETSYPNKKKWNSSHFIKCNRYVQVLFYTLLFLWFFILWRRKIPKSFCWSVDSFEKLCPFLEQLQNVEKFNFINDASCIFLKV